MPICARCRLGFDVAEANPVCPRCGTGKVNGGSSMTWKRSLAVVLVVCCAGLALYWVVRANIPAETRAAWSLAELGCTVTRDTNRPGDPVVAVRLSGHVPIEDFELLAHFKDLHTLDLGDGITVTMWQRFPALKSLTTLKVCPRDRPPGLRSLRELGLLHTLERAV